LDCPEFEYEHVNGHRAVLADRVAQLLVRLRRGQVDTRSSARDTRPAHAGVFATLTPTNVPQYAGHYRGENLPCLKDYTVGVQGDPRVGFPPDRVLASMQGFSADVGAALNALDAAKDMRAPEAQKLNCIVVVACRLLERFLAIHPYANGNGHMGRFIVWLVLGRYDYWPYEWPVEPRPPDPPYTEYIVRARNGERHLLEQFVLGCIRGRPVVP
jgi:hypothetical protein